MAFKIKTMERINEYITTINGRLAVVIWAYIVPTDGSDPFFVVERNIENVAPELILKTTNEDDALKVFGECVERLEKMESQRQSAMKAPPQLNPREW